MTTSIDIRTTTTRAMVETMLATWECTSTRFGDHQIFTLHGGVVCVTVAVHGDDAGRVRVARTIDGVTTEYGDAVHPAHEELAEMFDAAMNARTDVERLDDAIDRLRLNLSAWAGHGATGELRVRSAADHAGHAIADIRDLLTAVETRVQREAEAFDADHDARLSRLLGEVSS